MDTKYPLYTPKDIFISFCGREATEAERWQGVQSGIIFHKRTGNEFLDLFASMVHHYMNHDPVFYAKKIRRLASRSVRLPEGTDRGDYRRMARSLPLGGHPRRPAPYGLAFGRSGDANGLQFGENLQSRLHRACRHTSVPLAGEI